MAEFRETSGPPHDRPQSNADRLTAFGHCRFNPGTGQLWRGRREVKLTPRAASVLAVLVEQAGQIVTKQMLNETVWGGIAVGDDAITSCIQEVRQALGDKARKPLYIETRHRRGYRLIAPVTVAIGIVVASPASRRARRAAGRIEPTVRACCRGASPARAGERRTRHRQERTGRLLPGRTCGRSRHQDRPRPMPRSPWRGRTLPADDRRIDAHGQHARRA